MRIYTVLLCFLGVFTSSTLLAQVVVNVTAPAGLASSYQAGFADFGPEIGDQTFAGDLVYLDGVDSFGCSTISADLTGKIALIDRGNCEFSDKAFYAQEAGAIAVILALESDRILSFVLPAGNLADQVTIPMVSLLPAEHNPLKQALQIGDVSVEIKVEDEFAGPTPIYTEEFDGGLGDWTIEYPQMPDSPWVWSRYGQSQQSVFFVNSPTAQTNGSAVFDASFFNRDVTGPAPYPSFTAELISPVIDASDHEVLNLVFYQSNWPLNARNAGEPQTFFQYSIDGGDTYSEIIAVNTDNVFTATQTNAVHTETVRILMEDLAFTENLRLKFTFSGDFYFWGIDDIRLFAPPSHDLVVEDIGYPVQSFATPVPFIKNRQMDFIAALLNAGTDDQFDSDATISITSGSNTPYSETILNSLNAFERDTVSFTPYWPSLSEGAYEMIYSYENSGSSDEIPDNNAISRPFVVTENIFAQELANQDEIVNGYTASTGNYFFGTFVQLDNLLNPCEFIEIEIATFAADGEFGDESFPIYILKWSDDNDGYPQFSELNDNTFNPLDRSEFEVVAVVEFVPDMSVGQHQLIKLPISSGEWLDANFQPIDELDLEEGTYAIVGNFENADIGFSTVVGSPTTGASLLYNVNSNSPNTYFTGFTSNAVPVIRTRVNCEVDDISSVDPISSNQSLTIRPTITRDEAYLMIEDIETGSVSIEIYNMQGQLMINNNWDTSSGLSLPLGVSDFIPGTYLVKVSTKMGSWSEKIVKQ